jgi:glycosyltransferase involved in cell wall biosynthesis
MPSPHTVRTGRIESTAGTITLSIPEQNPTDITELDAISHGSASSTVMVGIPCYNEEVAIGSLVLRASQYADQVVVLDDGSTDKTAEVARFAGARVLVHDVNMGKGTALHDLFQYATQAGFDIIVVIDGDGQHNPDDIPKLVEPLLRDEADVVNGSRYLSGGAGSTPRYRRFGQVVLDKVVHFGLNGDVTITDTQSGFRAFSIKTAPFFKFNSDELTIDSEMLMDAANAHLRIKEVDVGVRYDVGRSSKHPVSHGLQVLTGVLRSIEFNRPLLAFTVPGLIFVAVAAGLAAFVIQAYYVVGHVVFGPTLLMLLLAVVGTFLVFTGIILHSVSALVNSGADRRGESR